MSPTSIRYRRADLDETQSKELHAEVATRIEQSGKFWFSITELKGKTWFRIHPVNFRTRTKYIDQLLALLDHECYSFLQNRGMASSAEKSV